MLFIQAHRYCASVCSHLKFAVDRNIIRDVPTPFFPPDIDSDS